MIDIRDKVPGDPITAEDFNTILAELRRHSNWKVAAPLELYDKPTGFAMALSAVPGGAADEVWFDAEMDGGYAGGASGDCTFTYTVYDDNDDPILFTAPISDGEGGSHGQRIPGVTYVPGTRVCGRYEGEDLILFYANEEPYVTVCEESGDGGFDAGTY